MVVIGIALVFAAIVFFVLGLLWQAPNPMSARVAGIRGERFSSSAADEQMVGSLSDRVLAPMAVSMGATLQRLLPANWVRGIERKLVQAGEPVTLGGFLVGAFLVEGVIVLFILTLIATGSLAGVFAPLVIGGLALIGAVGPKVWLDNRVRFRQKEIIKSLPDAFDLITTCVEAGLGLEAALARVAEKVEGPFGEELALSLREVALGKLRRDALKELAGRVGVPDLTTFINAVIQAESMGTSIANVLRVQAEQMRMKRRQRAEQQAHAAPIKMMFPLVLCIFPTLFIVILGPAGIQIYEQFVSRV